MPLTLAIIGRPNVGKSTLFNRLAGKKLALIDDTPGVTRDRRIAPATLGRLRFDLIDTAGYEEGDAGTLAARMWAQTERAVKEADVSLFVIDGRAGVTPDDRHLARLLRKNGKPVILLVNKCEGTRLPSSFNESYELNFGEPIAMSASHGEGLGDVEERLCAYAGKEDYIKDDEDEELDPDKKPLHLAIVGRPNAGKSTLVNHLIGEERMLTGPEPGLTRDAIQVRWEHQGRAVRLVDTAGLRRKSRIDDPLEKMSTQESLRAIRLAHVVVLVVDATQALEKQDLTIAHHVDQEGRALVIAVNKWDLVKDRKTYLEDLRDKIENSLAQMAGIACVTLSALHGEGTETLMQAVFKAYATWNKRMTTGQLNRWLAPMVESHPPPLVAGRRIKLRYMTQIKSRPPTFALWVNKPLDLPDSYTRFMTNALRRAFKLEGVPVRWVLKKGENPYDPEK